MIELKNDSLAATFLPEHGGTLAALKTTINDTSIDLVRTIENIDQVKKDPLSSACFACAPYFGRLYEDLNRGWSTVASHAKRRPL